MLGIDARGQCAPALTCKIDLVEALAECHEGQVWRARRLAEYLTMTGDDLIGEAVLTGDWLAWQGQIILRCEHQRVVDEVLIQQQLQAARTAMVGLHGGHEAGQRKGGCQQVDQEAAYRGHGCAGIM